MIKAMADLDTVFFAGRLKGSVVVVWAGEEEILEKGCEDGKRLEMAGFLGLCQPLVESGELRCKVWLNADAIFDQPDPREHMWKTVLHELVVSGGPVLFLFFFSFFVVCAPAILWKND